MRALLLYNPNATTTTPAVVARIRSALSAELKLDVEATRQRGHATELARAAVDEGYDVCVALGGDGTVNETLQGLALTPVRLAVLPGGSTNVFARILGLGRDPVAATAGLLRRLREGEDRTVNLGVANDRFFAFCAGLGYDADVVRMVDERPRMKQLVRQVTFLWCGALSVLAGHASTPRVTLSTGTAPPVRGLGTTVCCNADPYTFLGPLPARMCPQAGLDAGLDVSALTRSRFPDLVRVAATALTGDRVPALRNVVTWHDRDRFELTSAAPLPLQVDGEYTGETRRVVLRTVRRAVTVVA